MNSFRVIYECDLEPGDVFELIANQAPGIAGYRSRYKIISLTNFYWHKERAKARDGQIILIAQWYEGRPVSFAAQVETHTFMGACIGVSWNIVGGSKLERARQNPALLRDVPGAVLWNGGALPDTPIEPDGACLYMVENQRRLAPGQDWLPTPKCTGNLPVDLKTVTPPRKRLLDLVNSLTLPEINTLLDILNEAKAQKVAQS